MQIKMFDSELKVMEILWAKGEASAKDIAAELKLRYDWSKTTTYTVIKKCIDKGAVSRTDPGFVCRAEISRREVCDYETNELIDKLYDGSADKLVASLLGGSRLSADEIKRLKDLVNSIDE